MIKIELFPSLLYASVVVSQYYLALTRIDQTTKQKKIRYLWNREYYSFDSSSMKASMRYRIRKD